MNHLFKLSPHINQPNRGSSVLAINRGAYYIHVCVKENYLWPIT